MYNTCLLYLHNSVCIELEDAESDQETTLTEVGSDPDAKEEVREEDRVREKAHS